MKNRSMQNLKRGLCFLGAMGLMVAAGCPARTTSGDRNPDILSAVADEPGVKEDATAKPKKEAVAQEREPYFMTRDKKPWPKPEVALVFSGRQDGYVEPCGCAGLENQLGGLSRRDMLIKELRAKGWPVIALDTGGQVRRYGKQAELQFSMSNDALKIMKY